jgi:hypothetical protein
MKPSRYLGTHTRAALPGYHCTPQDRGIYPERLDGVGEAFGKARGEAGVHDFGLGLG